MILKSAVNWDFIVHETPTNPRTILNFFQENKKLEVLAPDPYPSRNLIQPKPNGIYRRYPRLVFFIQKH